MIPKNRIHLSRSLHAQTTPYPEAGRWMKRGAFVLVLVLVIGIYFYARIPHKAPSPAVPKQILGEQAQNPKTEYQMYSVKKGDTLFNLSQRFNVSWQTLADLNGLQEPYVLKIGQQIKIPQSPAK
jgi:hypothetical protein